MTTEPKTVSSEIAEMNPVIKQNMRDENQYMTVSGNVRNIFQNHIVDMVTGENGCMAMICRILKERGAEFPSGIETTELRQIALSASMTAVELKEEIDRRFSAGSTRHPLSSIQAFLGVHLYKKQGKVGKIKMTSHEDRNCKTRPAVKWYLIAK
jgi:hypothetical protein